MTKQNLNCQCGTVSISVISQPIMSVECLCTDCQKAGALLQHRKGAPTILKPNHSTGFVMYRKDRVEFLAGQDKLKSLTLNEDSKTRRVIASCCNTPMFLEFSDGHWLSIYGLLWPTENLPPLEMRTMTRSRPEGVVLSDDVPNPKTHTLSFMVKLLAAWVAMRFRVPKLDFISGKLED
ncbi:GFA family protein [Reinekea sp.]|jgi:hypothetical protein|uniref:GFA family protein n=1 Tax=Reinekea sp. TaxID=1970455 RepID=UPI00398A01EF